jgi:hypothetical protein
MTNATTSPNLSLLLDRKAKLDHKPFDWAAWKKGTLLVLKVAFGEESPYFKQLNEIEYEYSSWSLRDTSGSSDPVKPSCEELLDICILDIQNQDNKADSHKEKISELFFKYLPAKTNKKIAQTISSDLSAFQIEEKINTLLKDVDASVTKRLLAAIIQEISSKEE